MIRLLSECTHYSILSGLQKKCKLADYSIVEGILDVASQRNRTYIFVVMSWSLRNWKTSSRCKRRKHWKPWSSCSRQVLLNNTQGTCVCFKHIGTSHSEPRGYRSIKYRLYFGENAYLCDWTKRHEGAACKSRRELQFSSAVVTMLIYTSMRSRLLSDTIKIWKTADLSPLAYQWNS